MDARSLTVRLLGHWHGRYGTAPCPVCQPERRADQRGLSLRNSGDKLLAFCFKSGCSFGDITQAAGLPRGAVSVDPAAKREAEAKQAAYVAKKHARAAPREFNRAVWRIER